MGGLTIDGARLWARLMELALIGAYDDPDSGRVGVNRLAVTDGDAAARRLVMRWMRGAGLDVSVDEMGNIFGRRSGLEADAAPVMMGSHIDTVATAGAFDGCLGVLGALEVVAALESAGITTRRPLDVAVWTEEEGVRFGTDMLGSAVAAGRIQLARAHGLRDAAGLRLVDELARIGFRGDRPVRLDPPYAYVECHIEQGPVLLQAGLPVGVVTGVQSISWQRVILHGRAAHSGTTPTALRVDAGLAAAGLIVQLREMVDSGRYGDLRATVGQISVEPGLTNVVPARAVVTVDLRNPSDAQMGRAEADLSAYLDSLPGAHPGLRVETQRMAKTAAVPFDERVQAMIEAAAADLDLPTMPMISGAGHDAQELAAITSAAMVFVRGQNDGISHNPREFSTPEDCVAGVRVLAETVRRLAAE